MTEFIRAMEAYGTAQQLADDSGVPLQTIKRIKSGATEAPGIDTVVALARTMELSLDHLFHMAPEPKDEAEPHRAAPALPCHGHGSCAIVRQVRDIYEEQIKYQKKIIRVLGCACAVLVVFILALFAYDILNPTMGWFRYQARNGMQIPHVNLGVGKFDSYL